MELVNYTDLGELELKAMVNLARNISPPTMFDPENIARPYYRLKQESVPYRGEWICMPVFMDYFTDCMIMSAGVSVDGLMKNCFLTDEYLMSIGSKYRVGQILIQMMSKDFSVGKHKDYDTNSLKSVRFFGLMSDECPETEYWKFTEDSKEPACWDFLRNKGDFVAFNEGQLHGAQFNATESDKDFAPYLIVDFYNIDHIEESITRSRILARDLG